MNKSLKIGIMTLSSSDNCGSCLQAYALLQVLEKYGKAEIINFVSKKSHIYYDLPQMGIKKRIECFFDHTKHDKYKKARLCKKKYEEFRSNHLRMDITKEIDSELLHSINEKYDVFVVGSDQVWNVLMGDFDEAFFLGWTDKKKIAYAPSLGGVDIRSGLHPDKYIEQIRRFNYISVRENTGKKCLDEICKEPVEKVLDPTLLLEIKDWRKLVGEPLVEGEYIFYYSWAYRNENLMEIVRGEGKRIGCPVIVIDSRKWINRDEGKYDFILSNNEGPISFLNLMYYAHRVFVESFHGVIFSYIFGKNFWLLDSHDTFDDVDSRLKEIVLLLNVKDRVLFENDYSVAKIEEPIKYESNSKLYNLKNESFRYLRKAFYGGEE
ncbi:polysaccharide pyruvyl transferase family protein [Butyrivibrio sp. INlla16]|uniref:polysaccharide pyruvyl transferase family protein n=1 Tax=Butyrivibrio sp. INlla16 TaxID=1520807 RepID=UPI000884F936|nr:polysaccharide pyruvyl transferase family protein [Butyrivibrio sp. INlla16]SDB68218.1 Polysaccharide pyruvyl transferase [Butyrivibrio sp. INlla16]